MTMIKFKPPSLDKISDYMTDYLPVLEARKQAFKFHKYYEANGWTTGKGSKTKPMKNWKLAVSNWVKHLPDKKTNNVKQETKKFRNMGLRL